MHPTIELVRRPGARGLLAAGLVGRIPMGTIGLGLTLLVLEATGSFATTGAMTGAMTLSAAVAVPVLGRLADRVGQRRFLPVLVVVNSATLLGLTVVVSRGWPMGWWWAAAVLAGASLPNLRAVTRTRWPGIAQGHRERAGAAALETVADESMFLLGPILATGVALRFGAAVAVALAAAAGLVGGLAVALQRRGAPPACRRRTGGIPGAAALGGVRGVVVTMLALGVMFGALNVGAVAFARSTSPHLSGVLVSALAGGSLLAGLVLSRGHLPSAGRRLRVGTAVLAAGLLPLPLVDSAWAFGAFVMVGGLGVAAAMTGGFSLVEQHVPRDRSTEGMAAVTAALSLGSAAGAALAGRLAEGLSVPAAMLLPAAAALAAALAARAPLRRSDHAAAAEGFAEGQVADARVPAASR